MPETAQHNILIVDDDSSQRDLLATFLGRQGFGTLQVASAPEALQAVAKQCPHMVVSDVRMQGMSGLDLLRELRQEHADLPVLLVTAFADVKDAVGAMRDGALDYLEKPIDFQVLLDCVRGTLGLDSTSAVSDVELPPLPNGIVVASAAMRHVLQEAALVAPAESRVLVTGESGTGKEVLANLIHAWSRRSEGPMVKINCAAIPENLLESELFGHEKGAFTGAHRQRIGKFEQANNGTLFLDEIGEMSPSLQAKLLRVIQDGIVERVGAIEPVYVDVRVVAATNRDLETEVAEGRFREDLYYRLSVIEIHLPPLRERPEDVLPLAELFASRYGGDRPQFSSAVLALLPVYAWPGNVRELQNAMERATLMARGGAILPDHLPRRINQAIAENGPTPVAESAEEGRMERMERALILQTLREHDYNRTETARALGISRRTLTYKLRALREAGYPVDPA
ncbi:MAG: sigma-54-dependent Fis family transcriptional regulator [Lentisphaerae bacterium]|jgi:DNA-binding NtrC family response regulator|nr:sigma-54-dependent Fis family transcriptional regulator [Lentisphaerota bacterium]MBT4814069.1 sigma-54-dependent Fis family transcriptional regulator [Lentisphaerota bacterium]MBT5605430.1 sigma-54-dependent Fis family transcriptional regulator [Lentisphaerota bacterium]MBT7060139.1 sigma-54-dependent Fis family transcriptional regulator [Lentisphaerota bacterium]MBT7840801.1 sigma-54-dependent Fis family transcriptional regulator [Lentisphaerota bacterium]